MSQGPASGQTTQAAAAAGHGQAALARRLAVEPEIRYRAVTGAVLWSMLAVIAIVRELVSGTNVATSADFYRYTAAVVTMALLCLIVGPRLRGRPFRVAEELTLFNGWLAIAGLVYVTGGSSSVDIGLFAGATFYAAYFMSPRSALRQIAFGSAVMWLPALYQSGAQLDSEFALRAGVMTAVLWVMAALIMRNRQATRRAELAARRMALSDPLTGVANLRTFVEETQYRLAEAQKADASMGVAFVDVNGLKVANTVHGHGGGDQLIRRTADALLAASGPRDQVARIGGDEFAVLVPGADRDEMHDFEQRFAVALTQQRSEDGPQIDLSASIGSATFPADGASFDGLMDVADGRMYDSKAALPPRLPTPGTAGGRSLSDQSPQEAPGRLERVLGSVVPETVDTWLLAATTALAALAVFATGTSASPILAVAALLRYNSYRAERAEQRVLELAHTDMLTGLANRRVFETTLARAAEGPRRGGLILADVDDFKAVNSSGGHRTGDEVLRMVASVLDGAAGPAATVCRIGGDEFAVILDEGDERDVMRAAAKCRAAIGAVDWHVLCEPTVTLSFGYSGWEGVASWKDIVIAADGAMGASKHAGKDRVSASGGAAQLPPNFRTA